MCRYLAQLLILIAAVECSGCLSVWGKRHQQKVQDARQLTLSGIDAAHDGEWQLATQLFTAALDRDPDDARTRYHLARALWQLSQREEAIAEMVEATELLRDDPQLYIELGRMYFDDGQLDNAEKWALAAIEIDWRFPEGRHLFGDIQLRRKKYDAALANYHRALAQRPNYIEVQLASAEIYRIKNRPRRALATLESILERDLPAETVHQVNYLKGLAQKSLQRYHEATRSFSKALAHAPENTELLFLIGETQMLEGKFAAAATVTRDGLVIDPENVALKRLLLQIESNQRRLATRGPQRR
ncbi:MAG: tetratricopeptide repeat protein [Pirellulaceae bacterium]